MFLKEISNLASKMNRNKSDLNLALKKRILSLFIYSFELIMIYL